MLVLRSQSHLIGELEGHHGSSYSLLRFVRSPGLFLSPISGWWHLLSGWANPLYITSDDSWGDPPSGAWGNCVSWCSDGRPIRCADLRGLRGGIVLGVRELLMDYRRRTSGVYGIPLHTYIYIYNMFMWMNCFLFIIVIFMLPLWDDRRQ